MSSADYRSELTPIEKGFLEIEKDDKLQKTDDVDEIIDYLMFTIRLAKKKTSSKKLPDVVKVKWVKVAVDASKTLLFSGVLDKKERRNVSGFQALFVSMLNEAQTQAGKASSHCTDTALL